MPLALRVSGGWMSGSRELTRRKVPTPRGGAWHPQLVARVLLRVEAV
jgi:hypothetical protein